MFVCRTKLLAGSPH